MFIKWLLMMITDKLVGESTSVKRYVLKSLNHNQFSEFSIRNFNSTDLVDFINLTRIF